MTTDHTSPSRYPAARVRLAEFVGELPIYSTPKKTHYVSGHVMRLESFDPLHSDADAWRLLMALAMNGCAITFGTINEKPTILASEKGLGRWSQYFNAETPEQFRAALVNAAVAFLDRRET